MTRSVALLLLVSSFALAASAFMRASAQTADCNWYAYTALKQQQRNEQGKCGFSGAEWSMSRQTHLAWCATQSPDRWRAEAQKREQMLAGCNH